jgi:hypothetical protein
VFDSWWVILFCFFQFTYGPGVDSASNRNVFQESSCEEGGRVKCGQRASWQPHRHLWDPRCLTTLQASTACYGDSFTLFFTYAPYETQIVQKTEGNRIYSKAHVAILKLPQIKSLTKLPRNYTVMLINHLDWPKMYQYASTESNRKCKVDPVLN